MGGQGRLDLAVGVGTLAVACLVVGALAEGGLAEGGLAAVAPVGASLAEAGLAEVCLVAACGCSPAASCLVAACPVAEGLVALEGGSLVAWSAEGSLPSEPLPCWVGRPVLVQVRRWLRRLDVRHIQDKTWSHPEWILHTLRTAWCNLSSAPPTRFLKASSTLLGNKATYGLE